MILGTDEGKLMTYNVQWDAKTRKFAFRLEHIKAVGHGKKPITNVTLFGDVGLLFSLCGALLSFCLQSELWPARSNLTLCAN